MYRYLIYKHFFSKIKRRLIKNTFINHLYRTKRPGIAGEHIPHEKPGMKKK